MRALLVSLSLAAGALLSTRVARAADPVVRLAFDGPEVTCADEARVRAQIAARLGRDPFRADADSTLRVRMQPSAERRWAGAVMLARTSGDELLERKLEAPTCNALFSDVVATVVLALDSPLLRTPPPRAADTVPAPPLTTAPAPALAPIVEAKPARGTAWGAHAALGGVLALGFAPRAAAGVTVSGGLSRGAFQLDIEGRGDLPPASSTDVSSTLLMVGVVPCYRASVARVCALGYAGSLRGRGPDRGGANDDASFYAAAGARGGVELPIGSTLFLRLHGDIAFPITRTTLYYNGAPAWETPGVAGAFGVAVGGGLFP